MSGFDRKLTWLPTPSSSRTWSWILAERIGTEAWKASVMAQLSWAAWTVMRRSGIYSGFESHGGIGG